jgi:thymidylate kinase
VTAAWIVVTGLDGSGKSTLVARLANERGAHKFRLPYHDFVRPCLAQSGAGSPLGDVHTDRLLFALDARLANYAIREFRRAGVDLVSQRGWMDNFIFGAVQGVSYEQTEAMLRPGELERPSAHVFLIAEPAVALLRLEGSERRDKYETAEFIALQYRETKRFIAAVKQGIPALRSFVDIPAILIDTTHMSQQELQKKALSFLHAPE